MLNTSLLTHRFMKDNIGATEHELLQALEDENGDSDEESPEEKAETERNSLTKSTRKSKKPKLSKQEMKAKLEAKEEGFDKWRDLQNCRTQKLSQLEPTYKGANKYGVLRADMIPEELKHKAEEAGLPNVLEETADEEFKRIEFKILEFDWIFRGDSAKMYIEELA